MVAGETSGPKILYYCVIQLLVDFLTYCDCIRVKCELLKSALNLFLGISIFISVFRNLVLMSLNL